MQRKSRKGLTFSLATSTSGASFAPVNAPVLPDAEETYFEKGDWDPGGEVKYHRDSLFLTENDLSAGG